VQERKAMYIPIPQWSAILEFENDAFSIRHLSGVANYYRIRNQHLELRVIGPAYQDERWRKVPPEAVLQHVQLRTPLASWLECHCGALGG
jgi:hypothetical protein